MCTVLKMLVGSLPCIFTKSFYILWVYSDRVGVSGSAADFSSAATKERIAATTRITTTVAFHPTGAGSVTTINITTAVAVCFWFPIKRGRCDIPSLLQYCSPCGCVVVYTYHEHSLRFIWGQTTIWGTPLSSPVTVNLITRPDGRRLENGLTLFKSRLRRGTEEERWGGARFTLKMNEGCSNSAMARYCRGTSSVARLTANNRLVGGAAAFPMESSEGNRVLPRYFY